MTDVVVPTPLYDPPATVHDLIRFHGRHKLLPMAHAPAAMGALGRLVASAGKSGDLARTWSEYHATLLATLAKPATHRGHVNALLHAVGYFRGVVDETKRQELVRSIELFATGASSLATPIRLIRLQAALHGIGYLTDQAYLSLPSTIDEP
jgi:uncharacterized protein YbgA (DUF1722 family)